MQDIGDLPVDELSLYAQATCVQTESAGQVRRALRAQLRRVPQEALDDIISGAVVDEVSSTNSIQNTTAGARGMASPTTTSRSGARRTTARRPLRRRATSLGVTTARY